MADLPSILDRFKYEFKVVLEFLKNENYSRNYHMLHAWNLEIDNNNYRHLYMLKTYVDNIDTIDNTDCDDTEFFYKLDNLETALNIQNAHILDLYTKKIKCNNEKYKKMIKQYITEFNSVLKNVSILYEIYCFTLEKLKYNPDLQYTLDLLPDLTMINYIRKYSSEVISNQYKYINTVKIYRSEEIETKFRLNYFMEYSDNDKYYNLSYNKYIRHLGCQTSLRVIDNLDIVISYTDHSTKFYRLSTGKKIYDVTHPESGYYHDFAYFDNHVTMIKLYEQTDLVNIAYFIEYDIIDDVVTPNGVVHSYNSEYNNPWVLKLGRLLGSLVNRHYHNDHNVITYDENSPYIYYIIKSELYVVKIDKYTCESNYHIIDLKYFLGNISYNIAAYKLLNECILTPSRIAVIEYNIKNSKVLLYVQTYKEPYRLHIVDEYIFELTLDINTLYKLINL